MPTLPIPGTDARLGDDEVFVIAEIGKNFIQSEDERPVEELLENAKALVDAAVDSGVDAVKFQTHQVDDEQLDLHVVSPHFSGSDRFAWVTRNTRATPMAFWEALKAHCDARGALFFSTPMSRGAARRLRSVGVPLWKVGSGDVRDYVLLDAIAGGPEPVIISSGMVSYAELDEVVGFLRERGTPTAVLYCVSEYPAPKESFNLASIARFRERYPDVVVGFSDHSIGDEAALAAIALGARIVEKHFSLSRDLWGSDHKVSMTPDEMRGMVAAIRAGQAADPTPYLGDPERELEGASNRFRPYFHKVLRAARDLGEGEALDIEAIQAMRPAGFAEGLPSHAIDDVVGRTATRPLARLDPITADALR